jgi:hypothetical protein
MINSVEDCIGAAFLALALGCLLLLAAARIYEWITGKRPRWLDD